ANIDVAVVGVAAEAETPAGEFLVEIVEHEIAQEGRERTTLRGALIHRTDQAVLHHPGLEKGPEKLEHAFVRHPRSDARHQTVVIDPVEKFFEIKIDHDRVARSDVLLCLSHRLVGGSPRPEAIAVLGESWVPPLLENLQQGLLDQSIDDARDAELSDPAIRLGDFDPLDRLRLVGSREQLRPDVWPVLTQVDLGALNGHSIDARATSVTANSFPRSYEISTVAHLLHQLFCAGRAFGCGLRHGWFGPWCPRPGASPRPSGTKASEYWIFCRVPLMSCQSYLPLSIVRAFGPRFRLDLSVAPPFSLGVPHEPCRRLDLICPLLTSAPRSDDLAVASVACGRHEADLPA